MGMAAIIKKKRKKNKSKKEVTNYNPPSPIAPSKDKYGRDQIGVYPFNVKPPRPASKLTNVKPSPRSKPIRQSKEKERVAKVIEEEKNPTKKERKQLKRDPRAPKREKKSEFDELYGDWV